MTMVPNDELNKAIDRWLYIKATQPAWLTKNFGKNPFDPWPPSKEAVDAFLLATNVLFPEGTEKETITNTIDPKKREELLETFDREYQKAETIRDEARESAKKRIQAVIKQTLEEQTVDPNQKGVLFNALEAKSEANPTKPVSSLMAGAIEAGEVYQVFATQKAENQQYFEEKFSFSKLKGLSNAQKVFAPIADAVTTVFPNLKSGAINITIAESLDKLLNSTDKLTSIFGGNLTSSPAYTKFVADANKLLAERSPGRGGAIFGDFISSFFRGPTESTIISYAQLYTMPGASPVPNYAKLQAASMGLGSNLFHVALGEAKNYAIKKGLTALAGEAAGGLFGGPWGFVIALGSNLLGKVGSWLKGLTGTTSGEVPGDKIILGMGCVVLFILIILPITSQLIIDSALVGRLHIGGGHGTGTIIDCQGDPTNPACTFKACVGDCRWPASGVITQGPFTGGYCSNPAVTSHDTGNAANGIDIANFDGGPVYTPKAGTVTEAYSGCADNTGHVGDTCGGSPSYAGYGNHVIITTDDGYTLIFGHLESALGVKTGQHVEVGTQIGWMDQTGNSTGTHLHFGVLSGGNVIDVIPQNDPGLAPGDIAGCLTASSCTKACPTTPVVAGK